MRWPKWLIDPEQDEYFSRVDDEIRQAGEVRYPIGFALLWFFIAAVCLFTVWKVLS